ncbi:phytoene desaturase family protein [Microlunatus speluncae]|uniref:phytoene desaturase family protein n=1 Tax=Microlunatus speluncae TaxID=2594267 RepID=UPI0012661E3A|nr:NAD(P)/FAD-dependent oxidoreductase [Microlunatus speluncae]
MAAADADVVIVGGGHNAGVAAAYLGRAGLRVIICEARDRFGGAVASEPVFPGIDATLSRFSYLVSLLPERIMRDLDLRIELRSRPVASYTPVGDDGILVERPEGAETAASFGRLAGAGDYRAWSAFHDQLAEVAAIIAPTLTEPLPAEADLRRRIDPALWQSLVHRPLGELLEDRFADEVIRGIVATDALIGIDTRLDDPRLLQNRCFLYHVIGNGTGEWRVPVGGMGTVAAAIEQAARSAGAELRLGARVTAVRGDDGMREVELADGNRLRAGLVLANCAPPVLDRLRGRTPDDAPEGTQLKINMVLRRLPRLRSGLAPERGFAGTLHLHQSYPELARAAEAAAAGRIPDPLPCEVYCHTLTDPSILAPDLAAAGWHTLTLFGLHTPARLFRADPARLRDQARDAALRSLQDALAEPLADCLATDANGRPCIEVMSPLDVEAELAMPGGHIFHGDLSWPWRTATTPARTPAERWGVATDDPRILLCGSGAVRGGAVSGLGGHNAAQAALETLADA